MKAVRTSQNVIIVTCEPPYEINGPKKFYILEVKSKGSVPLKFNETTCRFDVKDLYYLTDYTFQVNSCFLSSLRSPAAAQRFSLSTSMAPRSSSYELKDL